MDKNNDKKRFPTEKELRDLAENINNSSKPSDNPYEIPIDFTDKKLRRNVNEINKRFFKRTQKQMKDEKNRKKHKSKKQIKIEKKEIKRLSKKNKHKKKLVYGKDFALSSSKLLKHSKKYNKKNKLIAFLKFINPIRIIMALINLLTHPKKLKKRFKKIGHALLLVVKRNFEAPADIILGIMKAIDDIAHGDFKMDIIGCKTANED